MTSKYNFKLNLIDKNTMSVFIDRIEPNSTVLEFGPANGRLTRYLKENLNCKVYTVEIDEEAAKDAAQHSEEIIVGDIEAYEWKEQFKAYRFDHIVFADVLEHLYYPEEVLKSASSLLTDDGSILISLPNIAHNAVILDLFRDEFMYRKVGLLDDTHIRFFTKKSVDRLIENAGLHTHYETATHLDPNRTEIEQSYETILPPVADYLKFRPYGEVYQFIIEAKKYVGEKISELKAEIPMVLYWDTGSNFNIYQKKVAYIGYSDKKVCFDLPANIQIQAFRFDPALFPIAVELDCVQVDGISVPITGHNGMEMPDGKTLVFVENNPIIYFQFNSMISPEKVEVFFKTIKPVDEFYRMQIRSKEFDIKKLRAEVDQQNEIIQSKETK